EHLEIPRALSTLFWLLGGLFLYCLAVRLMPPDGAIAATAYFLLNPLGVRASVSFLPDPLMIGLFAATLLGIVRWFDRPTRTRLAVATGLAALAVLVKPLCLFGILGGFAALGLRNRGGLRRVLDPPFLLFVGGALLPAIAYYGYGVLFEARPLGPNGGMAAWDSVARQWSVTFDPARLAALDYWKGWLRTAVSASGSGPLVAGLVGIALARPADGRPLLLGLLAGYVASCLVFTYHITFAAYYHLQLLVPVALGSGVLVAVVMEWLRATIRGPWPWAPPLAAGLVLAVESLHAIRDTVRSGWIEPPAIAREIGELIDHSDRTVHVAAYYGMPLQYYGEFFGVWWPAADEEVTFPSRGIRYRSVQDRLRILPLEPEYFVITDRRRYEMRHADLKAFLELNCQPIAERPAYLVYGRCRTGQSD
ncbi:MAG TPA: glycosyltransferase family 39 protein, partial [Gemmatimonadales bacterium]|nr:glycosyltransferase family 39 protein [Gemmatimonadales bacterium]